MIFKLKQVNKQIGKIKEVPLVFLQKSLNANSCTQSLLPTWFIPVYNRCPGVKGKFIQLFSDFKKVSKKQQNLLIKHYQDADRVKKICDDKSIIQIGKDFITNVKLRDSFGELIRFLFNETIGTKSFKKATGISIDDHYSAFIELNEIHVCPFCGLETYSLPKHRRAEYDHYLPISIYPCLGVNFDNLVPMGDICNGKKNNCNILYENYANKTRRSVWYPYEWIPHKMTVKCLKKPTIKDHKGSWQIDIVGYSKKNNEKIKTWRDVFNIDSQYNEALGVYHKSFIEDFARKNQLEGKKIKIGLLKKEFKKYRDTMVGNPKMETLAILKYLWSDYYYKCKDNSQLVLIINRIQSFRKKILFN